MPNTAPLKILISLHDATPFHLDRMRRAEKIFHELGLEKITYLLVPQYHGSYLASDNPEFVDWCRASRPFQVQWHLHGFLHRETAAPIQGNGIHAGRADTWKRKYLTAGEGEFLALDRTAIRAKVEAGRQVFRDCLQAEPEGFVAPAWLFNSELRPELKNQGIRFTEDHGRLYKMDSSQTLNSPVITWATRTVIRKYGSLVVCPLLARIWSAAPVLRVAMHPFDFDHSRTIANICKVLARLQKLRAQSFCSELEYRN
jgi:uncharacterized protein